MKISVHLCFDGQCETAFRTYERLLGGKVITMLAYGDSPMAEQVRPEWRERIVHASLELDGYALFGTDVPPDDYKRATGFFVTLSSSDVVQAKQWFEAMADGGEVSLPFQPTFWSAGYGVLIDRFGIPWEINC